MVSSQPPDDGYLDPSEYPPACSPENERCLAQPWRNSLGVCSFHWNLWKAGQCWRKCGFPGCERPWVGRRWCAAHFMQAWHFGGDRGDWARAVAKMEPIGTPHSQCYLKGCRKWAQVAGLCWRHLKQANGGAA